MTKLPIQYAARTTTGTGISYMQMELAYKDGTLIPEQKAEPENPKHPDELLAADRGGLVFTPRPGFFENVAELDFISEYPSIMAKFNISPETVNCGCCPDGPRVPELGYRVCQRRRGITSRVVERLIQKRQLYKQRAGNHVQGAAQCKLRRDALKWLLVCCFGYTGYKNARFGKIEAHEAINAMAREKLLVAKETAEASGYRVLHALVDSLYIQKPDATGEDYERLSRQIEATTNLPLAVEAVYRYVVFLPSKQDAEIPAPNRFFAVSQSGELKIRGLECRRHDTPPLVARMQRQALAILSEAVDFETYCTKLAEAREVYEQCLARLIECSVAPEELVISRRLTRSPRDYQKNNLTAIVARQLDRAGVELRPGENIQFIITDAHSKLLDDRVRAWTLWEGWRGYDVGAYQEALEKAFQPFTHFAHSLASTTASPSLLKDSSPSQLLFRRS
ncbi:MAG TPA: DNA polymerase domain-containing protein [Terriglobia bacterium]|nr:DNA polymerase domain-containing protein [Terriglobia bacterium]